MKIQTGKMPFKGFETYYRVVGEATANAPLLLLHGGPGSTHNYFEVLDSLAESTHRQVIFYDILLYLTVFGVIGDFRFVKCGFGNGE